MEENEGLKIFEGICDGCGDKKKLVIRTDRGFFCSKRCSNGSKMYDNL